MNLLRTTVCNFIIGSCCAVLAVFTIFRPWFDTPGPIGDGDLYFPDSVSAWYQYYNPYQSGIFDLSIAIRAPFFISDHLILFLSHFYDANYAVKLTVGYFFFYLLSTAIAFDVLIDSSSRNRSAAIAFGALAWSSNYYTLTRIPHWFTWLSMGSTPLLFALASKSVTRRPTDRHALAAGLLFAASGTGSPHSIVINTFVIFAGAIYAQLISSPLEAKTTDHPYFRKVFVVIIKTLFIVLLGNFYWIFLIFVLLFYNVADGSSHDPVMWPFLADASAFSRLILGWGNWYWDLRIRNEIPNSQVIFYSLASFHVLLLSFGHRRMGNLYSAGLVFMLIGLIGISILSSDLIRTWILIPARLWVFREPFKFMAIYYLGVSVMSSALISYLTFDKSISTLIRFSHLSAVLLTLALPLYWLLINTTTRLRVG